MTFLGKGIDILKEKNYRPSSIRSYNCNIKRIFNYLKEPCFCIETLTSRQDEILEYISKIEKLSSRKALINTVRIFIGKGNDTYNKALKKYTKEHRDSYHYSVKSFKNFKTLESLHCNKVDFHNISSHRQAIRSMVLGLYKYLPSLRGEDFYNTVIRKDLPPDVNHKEIFTIYDYNYIDVSNWKLVLGRYKTSDTYGMRILTIPEDLRPIILGWFEYKELKNLDPFITNKKGTSYSQPHFTRILYSIFGKRMSTDNLRKSYISEMIRYLYDTKEPGEAVRWRRKLAATVGHSLLAQEFIYSSHRLIKAKSSDEFMDEVFGYFKEATISISN